MAKKKRRGVRAHTHTYILVVKGQGNSKHQEERSLTKGSIQYDEPSAVSARSDSFTPTVCIAFQRGFKTMCSTMYFMEYRIIFHTP